MTTITNRLPLLLLAAAFLLTSARAAELINAKDGSGYFGYKDTPKLPWCDWLVHDPDRPAPKIWNHVALVRDGDRVAVYLNGHREPELSGNVPSAHNGSKQVFIAGGADVAMHLEGKIDEVAIYDLALTPDQICSHYQSASLYAANNK